MDRYKAFHQTETVTWLTGIAGLLLSLGIFNLALHWERENIEIEFHHVFHSVTNAFERELATNLGLVSNTVSFYNASNKVSKEEFRTFSMENIGQFSGIKSIGWAQKVTKNNHHRFLSDINEQNITIELPTWLSESQPNTDNDTFLPVVYIEPIDSNRHLVGFNLLSLPNISETLTSAQDLNIMASYKNSISRSAQQSGPIISVVLPVYKKEENRRNTRRNSLFGYIVAELKVDTIFENAIENIHTDKDKLNIWILDPQDKQRILYQRLESNQTKTNLSSEHTLTTNEVSLELRASATEAFVQTRSTSQPQVILAALLLLTALLTTYLQSLSKKHQLIEKTVKTRTKELENSENKLRTILDAAGNGIVLINENGDILLANPAMATVLGYDTDQLLGQNFSLLVPKTCREIHETYLDTFRSTDTDSKLSISLDATARHQDGNEVPVHISISDLHHDNSHYFVCVLVDLSERIRNEKMRTEFISTVSHELRTPLTSINGALKLVLSQFKELPQQANELLGIAHRNTERQLHLVNDLLDLQKIAAGEMQFSFETINLSEAVNSAKDGLRGISEELSIQIDVSDQAPNLMVRVDRARLTQIITNLLSNAIKFSPEHGKVTITIDQLGNKAKVSISDEGPGIPFQFRERIFTRFAQADSSDQRSKGGTGLGLAITKDLVEGMNGDISYHSPPGEGATFYFHLPINLARNSTETAS